MAKVTLRKTSGYFTGDTTRLVQEFERAVEETVTALDSKID
jgi:hypothetical protein